MCYEAGPANQIIPARLRPGTVDAPCGYRGTDPAYLKPGSSRPRSPDLGNVRWRTVADATCHRMYLRSLTQGTCPDSRLLRQVTGSDWDVSSRDGNVGGHRSIVF